MASAIAPQLLKCASNDVNEGHSPTARAYTPLTEEQISYAIRQSESGTPVGDLYRQLGVSDATFYAWEKKYGHLGVSKLCRLRQMEEERLSVRVIPAGRDRLQTRRLPAHPGAPRTREGHGFIFGAVFVHWIFRFERVTDGRDRLQKVGLFP